MDEVKDNLKQVLLKAMQDMDFAVQLKRDPTRALNSIGIAPTPERLDALSKALDSLALADYWFGGAKPD